VENDSNVMAMAEMGKGVARGVKDFIFLRVGHGVGAGIVAGGMLYRGFRGFSGEVGHTIFDGSSKVCVCGNQGCVETEAGSDAVLEEAALLAKKDSGSYLAKHLDSYNGITLRDIGIAAGAGDEACMKLIKKTGEALGVAVSSLVNVLNPELIVVGGPTTDLGEMLLTSMRQSLMRRTLPQSTSELVVRRTKLGDSIGMVGAAYMVQEDILSSKNVVKIIDQHKAGTLERRQRARRK
jgi:predicted NBD/HSP70 family sugar kinase